MAAMAPALTEAATQVRAKLPSVGHTTDVNGRRDCPSPSPTDVADPLVPPPPTPRSSTETPPAAGQAASAAGKTPSLLLTLPKQQQTEGGTPSQAFNIGIRRVSVRGPAHLKAGLGVGGPSPDPTPLLQGGGLPSARPPKVAKLSNFPAGTTTKSVGRALGKSRLAASLGGQRRPIQGNTAKTTSSGDLVILQTVGRMSTPQQGPVAQAPSTSAGRSTPPASSSAGSKMPHSATAPNVQAKSPGMGYTSKSATPSQPTTSQTPGSQMMSGTGSVATSSATSSSSNTSTSGTSQATGSNNIGSNPETDSLSLQTMDDIASVTLVDIQSGSSTGMADVGLLNNVDRVAETAKRQKELERHADRLLRRMRRLQSRKTISHVQHQLSGFVDHQHKNLQTMAKAMKPQPTNSVDLKAELLQSEDVKSLSTAALVSLVRRLQTSQAMTLRQRLANSSQSGSDGTSVLRLDEDLCTEMNRVSSTLQKDLKHLEAALDSDATESSSGGESCDEDYDYDEDKVPKACLRRRAEWRWATERAAVAAKWTWLQAQVSDLEYRIRQQSDIYRQIRAAKGAVVLGDQAPPEDLLARLRANTASATASTPGGGNRVGRRLSPLEEKIANLERKNEMSPCNLSTLLCNVDKQSLRLTQQLGNVLSPAESPVVGGASGSKGPTTVPTTPPKTPNTPNGLLGGHTSTTPGANTDPTKTNPKTHHLNSSSSSAIASELPLSLSFDPPSPAVDSSCQAARCRPVRSYGKRKLLTTGGLYQLSRKAARLSTEPCHCYPPTVPCAMCGGRYNNMQTVQPTVMPVSERVALLDPSYHQVLSFPQDTPLPIHFESLLRCGEWQHKPLPTKPLRPLGSGKGRQKGIVSERKSRKNASATILSAKIRSKYDLKQLSRNHGNELTANTNDFEPFPSNSGQSSHSPELKLKKRKSSLSGLRVHDGARKKRNMSTSSAGPGVVASPTSASPRDTPSPLSHSCPSSTLRDMKEAQQRRRRGESAFDINNIVIPYSMAASTRVEKLLYKEIITPKWRKIGSTGDKEEVEPLLPTPTMTPEQEPASRNEQESQPAGSAELPPTPITPSTPHLSTTSHTTPTPHSVLTPPTPPTTTHTGTPSQPTLSHTSNSQTPTPKQPSPSSTLKEAPSTTPQTSDTPEPPTPTTSVPVKPSAESDSAAKSEPTSDDCQTSVSPTTSKSDVPTVKLETPEETPMETSVDEKKAEGTAELISIKLENPGAESTKTLTLPKPGGNGLVLSRKIVAEEEEEDEELEDLSDELIAVRHMRCEIKEKKRFTSVVKKRSRGGRADSISASMDDVTVTSPEASESPTAPVAAGATSTSTPVPSLPSTSSVPSFSTSTPPGTPVMAPPPQLTALIDEELELAGVGRRRSGSCSSHEDMSVSGSGAGRRRSLSGRLRSRGTSSSLTSFADDSMEEGYSGADPWPCRTFPLSDPDYDQLFQDDTPLPVSSATTSAEAGVITGGRTTRHHSSTTTKGGYTYHTATPENSNPASPMPSSSNSSVMDDDPNDPEWTVVDGAEKPILQTQPGIVLKLAKR